MNNGKQYKPSLYNIIVKLPDKPNQFLLVHGYSGAIDLVNKNVVNLLKSKKLITPGASQSLNISEDTVQNLIKRGYLTDMSPVHERDYVHKMATIMHKIQKRKSGFLFLVAYDCNFRCPYCYENTISSSGRAWSKKVFTKEMVDRAYETMLEINPDDDKHSKTIILYGGEPLLKENYNIVKYIVKEGVKRGYKFDAVTNGFDLQTYSNLLGKENIKWLQITIDGNQINHNNRRIHYIYGNSFNRIIKNIGFALKKNIKVSLRINIDKNNFDELNDLLILFKNNKWDNDKNFSVYSALIENRHREEKTIKCNIGMNKLNDSIEEQQSQEEESSEIEKENYSHLIDFRLQETIFNSQKEEACNKVNNIQILDRKGYLEKHYHSITSNPELQLINCQNIDIERLIMNALKRKELINYHSYYCGAQTGMFIFDPFGDLYTCWEAVGLLQDRIGTFSPKLEIDKHTLNKWFGRNITTQRLCPTCKYALLCGGGCEMRAIVNGEGYDDSWCDSFPHTFHTILPKALTKYLQSLD